MFYGCNFAADQTGEALIQDIARLSQADIAASSDVTGTAALDGDWDLEYRTGDIEAPALSATAFVNTLAAPSDIQLTGDRTNNGGDRALSTSGGDYVVKDGSVKLADNTIVGELSTADAETNGSNVAGSQTGISYTLGGTHASYFTVSSSTLQLASASNTLGGGEYYYLSITARDADGEQYTENYTLREHSNLQVTQNGVNVASAGTPLLDENVNGKMTPETLGTLGYSDLPAGAQNVLHTLVSGTGGTDNAKFALNGSTLSFIGANSGDADAASGGPDQLSIRAQTTYTVSQSHNTNFTGYDGADATFNTSDADTRTFSYSGGAITPTTGNLAPIATKTTDVGVWLIGSADANLAKLVDGIYSYSYPFTPWAVTATGDNITFTFSQDYNAGSFKFYQWPDATPVSVDNIDGATVAFIDDGTTQETLTLNHANQDASGVITVTPNTNVVFDEVVLTFAQDGQITPEIEIFGASDLTKIDISSGIIYLADGNAASTITFGAVSGLDVAAGYSIIVSDNGNGTGSVQALANTSGLTPGSYYVLGTISSTSFGSTASLNTGTGLINNGALTWDQNVSDTNAYLINLKDVTDDWPVFPWSTLNTEAIGERPNQINLNVSETTGQPETSRQIVIEAPEKIDAQSINFLSPATKATALQREPIAQPQESDPVKPLARINDITRNDPSGEDTRIRVSQDGQIRFNEFVSATTLAPLSIQDVQLDARALSVSLDDIKRADIVSYSLETTDGTEVPDWVRVDVATGETLINLDRADPQNRIVTFKIIAQYGDGVEQQIELRIDLEGVLPDTTAPIGPTSDAGVPSFTPLDQQIEKAINRQEAYGDTIAAALGSAK